MRPLCSSGIGDRNIPWFAAKVEMELRAAPLILLQAKEENKSRERELGA
jgi:hypothetical protein